MRAPESFYYTEKESSERYNVNPPGELNVERLIKNEPAYRQPGMQSVEKKKSLVLSSWRGAIWGRDEEKEIRECLTQLLKDGFPLYVWIGDKLEKITLKDLDKFFQVSCVKMKALYDDNISKEVLIKNKLSPDKIHVIDDFELQQLRLKSTNKIFKLRMNELATLRDPELDRFIDYCNKKKMMIHIEFLIESDNDQDTHELMLYKIENIKNISTSIANISGFADLDIISKISPEMIDKKIKEYEKQSYLTLKVEEGVFGIDEKVDQRIYHLINANKSLQSLAVLNADFDNLDTLHELRDCKISDQDLTVGKIFRYLKKMPFLRMLYLEYLDETSKDSVEGNHPYLNELIIERDVRRVTNGVNALLNSSPNLLKLTLNKVANSIEILRDSACLSLKKLKIEFDLGSNQYWENDSDLPKISVDSLNDISHSCPGLKEFKVSHFVLVKTEDRNEINKNLCGINQLDILLAITDKVDNLWQLLNFTRQIKTLSIIRFDVESAIGNKNPVNLLSMELLEEIVLTACNNFTTENLIMLLQASPNLKKITISICPGINFNDPTVIKLIRRIPLSNINMDVGKNLVLVDPDHDPKSSIESKETPADFKFSYDPVKNKTLSQGMIINQLSQYLTVTNNDLHLIPKIQDGICVALTKVFVNCVEYNFDWVKLLSEIQSWDGNKNTLTHELQDYFERILGCVKKFQMNQSRNNTYFGDALVDYIEFMDQGETVYLANHNHQISVVRYNDYQNEFWIIYDPNYIGGYKTFDLNNLSEVMKEIKRTIGRVVSIEDASYAPKPENLIKNISQFIGDGGLISVSDCKNVNDICLYLLGELANSHLSKDDLDGLLIRNTTSTPAWVVGMKVEKLKPITEKLLNLFIEKNPHHWDKLLAKSVEDLKGFDLHACIGSLVTPSKVTDTNQSVASGENKIFVKIRDTIRQSKVKPYADEMLTTWERKNTKSDSVKQYCRDLVQINGNRNRLVEVDSKVSVSKMITALQAHCRSIHRPFFYIHSPDDIVCYANWIERNGTQGVMHKGPGGQLYNFLVAHYQSDSPPVIIINYDQFSADDVVRLNSLLDKERKADRVNIPNEATIIGVIDPNKVDCYQGEDFYSRFNQKEKCPFNADQLQLEVKSAIPVISPPQENNSININLCHANNWKERLLGRWIINGDRLIFEEGELTSGLRKSPQHLHIQNGRWDLPEFERFFEEAYAKGYIDVSGEKIQFPVNLSLSRGDGYDWGMLNKRVQFDEIVDNRAYVLNPSLLSAFFSIYQCENMQLIHKKGYIESNAGKSMSVNITRNLSLDEWSSLLLECKKHNVEIKCHLSANITLPVELNCGIESVKASVKDGLPFVYEEKKIVIDSSDIDVTVAMITRNASDWRVIDVSECCSSDLLSLLTHKETNDNQFQFDQKDQVLLQLIKQGKKIILKGNFSDEMVDMLAPLLQGDLSHPDARLVLVTNNQARFTQVASYRHIVSVNEKKKLLDDVSVLTEEQIINESYSQLHARINYFKNTSDKNTDNAWLGMQSLPHEMMLGKFDPDKSAQKSREFIDNRYKQVMRVLDSEPYVYLTGMTAVGKSTFIEKNLRELNAKITLFSGESNLQAWANHAGDDYSILFIDEANMANRQFSEFEGLFNIPPGILINGVYKQLSEKHKVVFAGNPLDYGDERKLAPIFQRHGCSLVFEPLTVDCIYEEILRPVFEGSGVHQDTIVGISNHILNMYAYFCNASKNEVLISARELQMMAMMVRSFLSENKHADVTLATKNICFSIGQPLVPVEKREEFNRLFGCDRIKRSPVKLSDDFVMTQSRVPVVEKIHDMLKVRELKCSTTTNNNALKYGGLGGIILEGEPGIGKSELVIAALISEGYQKQDHTRPTSHAKPFYHMPVSMQLSEKKELLLRAFNEGAVVIIDEINSSPMMERLLNDLLMGYDENKKRPAHPGFMIVGTQNPVSMSGRREASAALSRRLMTEIIPPYTRPEMQQILEKNGLTQSEATSLVDVYLDKVAEAKIKQLTPAPTFRDLLDCASKLCKSRHVLYGLSEDNKNQNTQLPSETQQTKNAYDKNNQAFTLFGSTKTTPAVAKPDSVNNDRLTKSKH